MNLREVQKRIEAITEFLNDRKRIERLREEGISAEGIKARLIEENRPKIAELRVLEKKLELHEKWYQKWWVKYIIFPLVVIVLGAIIISWLKIG